MTTNELTEKARQIIENADLRHQYSVNAIYEVYNALSGNNEKPKSCTTCLLNKVKEIRQWLAQAEGDAPAKRDHKQ